MKKIIAALCLSALLLSGGAALAKGYHADFSALDASGDGKVTYEEFKALFPEASMQEFKEINASGSGAINEDEWNAYMNKAGMEDHNMSGHGAHK